MTTSWNPYVIGAFEAFFRPWMGRRIAARFIRGSIDDLPTNGRAIVVANHVSWWDAFLVRDLHRRANTGHPLYTLMGEHELERFPFFRKMGVVGISPDPSDIRHALIRFREIDSPFWLTFFPQGKIWPSHKRPMDFRRGVEMFARELAPCAIIPVALHLEPLVNPAPSAFVGIGEPLAVEAGDAVDVGTVERSIEVLLDELLDVLAAHGEAAGAVWTSTQHMVTG